MGSPWLLLNRMSAVVEPTPAPASGDGEGTTEGHRAALASMTTPVKSASADNRGQDNSATASPRWPGNDKPYRITMGMRACEERDWLLRGSAATTMIEEKKKVLAEHHDQVFVMTPAGERGGQEAAALIAAALSSKMDSDEGIHPLQAAARLVAEDLVIMSPRSDAPDELNTPNAPDAPDAQYVLTAGVVCSPSRWDLREKVGRTMREIHEPVPDYDSIAAPTDRFFTRLHDEDIIERTNWTVLDNSAGFQPAPGPSWDRTIAEISDDELLQHLWLRLERQTLRRLPESGSVLFTILTECTRLDEVSTLGEHVTRQLALWVSTTGQDVRSYRGWGGQAPRVAAALEAACSSSGH